MLKPVAALIPEGVRQRLSAWRHRGLVLRPAVGSVTGETLWQVNPISRVYGIDRGQPVDRYYIERFLGRHAADIQGHVLEVASSRYTREFGGARVTQSHVLHVEPGNPNATLVADLTELRTLPQGAFDCIILTQTLPFVFDLRAAVQNLHAMLKPGGVVLATVPGITKISRYDYDRWGQYWSFTSLSLRRLFHDVFPPAQVEVQCHGNVLAATAFLHGLASRELSPAELDHFDADYELLITLRAVRPE